VIPLKLGNEIVTGLLRNLAMPFRLHSPEPHKPAVSPAATILEACILLPGTEGNPNHGTQPPPSGQAAESERAGVRLTLLSLSCRDRARNGWLQEGASYSQEIRIGCDEQMRGFTKPP
jgi:hypothetical protein